MEPEEPPPPSPVTKEAKEKEGEATKRSSDELKYILREIELLKGLDHPNVIHLYDYFVSARPGHVPLSSSAAIAKPFLRETAN